MERLDYVTYAKAIAIMLIVLGHTSCGPFATHFVSMFHVPIFFFLSGYCFKAKYIYEPVTFCLKRLKGLYLPFIGWVVPMIVFHNFLCEIHLLPDNPLVYSQDDIIKRTIGALCFMGNNEPLVGGSWFLRSLLVASFLGFLIIKFARRPLGMSLICLFVAGLCIWAATLGISGGGKMLFWASHFLLATFYFLLGYAARLKNVADSARFTNPGYLLFCFAIIAVGAWFSPVSTRDYTIVTFPVLIVCSLAGIWLNLGVAKCLCGYVKGTAGNMMQFIGNHTLSILMMHFCCFKVVSLIIILICGLSIERWADYPTLHSWHPSLIWAVNLMAGVGIPLLVSFFVENVNRRWRGLMA